MLPLILTFPSKAWVLQLIKQGISMRYRRDLSFLCLFIIYSFSRFRWTLFLPSSKLVGCHSPSLRAFLSFHLTLQLFKYLEWSPRMSQLSRTISKVGIAPILSQLMSQAFFNLFYFLIMFSVVFLAFAIAGFVAFGVDISGFVGYKVDVKHIILIYICILYDMYCIVYDILDLTWLLQIPEYYGQCLHPLHRGVGRVQSWRAPFSEPRVGAFLFRPLHAFGVLHFGKRIFYQDQNIHFSVL